MPYTYQYPRPAVTTDIILIAKEKDCSYILLIERKFDPFKGYWAFPGGFVEMDEDLDTACLRELKEETGIANIDIKQFYTAGKVDRDPRGRTISVVYWAEIDHRIEYTPGDDAAKANWFSIKELPELAFDHQHIIDKFFQQYATAQI